MRLLVSTILVLAVSACSSPALLYTPTTPTVPMFERAGQVEATVGLSSGEGATGSVAVSPITGVLLLASGARIDVQDAGSSAYKRAYGEAGVGMYLPLADGIYFTAAGGLGAGSQEGSGRIRRLEPGESSTGGLCKPFCVPIVVGESWTYSSDVSAAFAQAGVTYQDDGSLSVALVMRATSTQFGNLNAQQYGALDDVRLTTIEPSLLLRYGIIPGLSAQMTTGVRYQLGGPDRAWPFYHDTFRLGFGIHGRLNAW